MHACSVLLLAVSAAGAGPCSPCDAGGPCAVCKACANAARDAPCDGCAGGTCAWCWEPHPDLPNDGKPCLGERRELCCTCWNLAARGTCTAAVPPPAPSPATPAPAPAPPGPPAPAPPLPPPPVPGPPAPAPPRPSKGCLLSARPPAAAPAANVSTAGPVPYAVGPYAVQTGTIAKVPGLTKAAPHSAYVVYPTPKNSSETFPVATFGHGTTSGAAQTLQDYSTLLRTVASYGFVIVATESCPTTECFAGFAADMLATVKACRDDPSLHPALATADFSRVGVFGHSMGAMAALAAAGPYKGADPSAYNIKAVVSQHPCSDPTVPRLGADVTVPVMFTAGSADTLCEDGCAWSMRDKATKAPSRVMFDLKGTTHFEPCNAGGGKAGGGGLEDTAVALFLSCWVRGDHCDKVYGASGRAICGQIPPTASLYSCTVNGTK